MANFKVLTCPNCNGTGCPTCKNSGKIRVAEDQLQKLKKMVGQMPSLTPSSTPIPQPQSPGIGPTRIKPKANLAGIITFSLLSILAGAATASWYFLRSLKPFFAGFISLFTLIGSRLAWKQPFFQPQEPDDFLKAANQPRS